MPRKPTATQLDARYARTYRRILRARAELTAAEYAMERILAAATGNPHPDAFRDAVYGDGTAPAYRTLCDAVSELAQPVAAP
jgi:hypothetical protein